MADQGAVSARRAFDNVAHLADGNSDIAVSDSVYYFDRRVERICQRTRNAFARRRSALFCLQAISVGVTFSLIRSFGALPDPPKIVQIIGFHVVAFFVVGLLAARLSDRSAHGEKLIETKKIA